MGNIDDFASQLFEEAKAFLERFDNHKKVAYLHAALNLAFCSLEAHVNAIAQEYSLATNLSAWDRAVLLEKTIDFEDGVFETGSKSKMYRLEDRITFLCRRFSANPISKQTSLWSNFKEALNLRNDLTHPREHIEVTREAVAKSLTAVLDILDHMYIALYKRQYPLKNLGLHCIASL